MLFSLRHIRGSVWISGVRIPICDFPSYEMKYPHRIWLLSVRWPLSAVTCLPLDIVGNTTRTDPTSDRIKRLTLNCVIATSRLIISKHNTLVCYTILHITLRCCTNKYFDNLLSIVRIWDLTWTRNCLPKPTHNLFCW